MSEFLKVWNNEVKELAKECLMGGEITRSELDDFVVALSKLRENEKKNGVKYKDPYGTITIARLIFKVEDALAEEHEELAKGMVSKVYSLLMDNEIHEETMFGEDTSSKERKRRKALKKGMEKLLKL